MGSSFQNKQRTGLVAAVAVMLFTLAGCSTLPEVKPPDPTQSDVEGQIRQFKEFTPQQVLTAAEEVLRKHKPEAKFVRSADTLKMETHNVGFIVIAGWHVEERWAVHAREEDQVTVASVAMDVRNAGLCIVCGYAAVMNTQLPKKAEWSLFGTVPAIDIDYGMFWHRVQSILTGAPWPECVKVWGIRPRYFEPLCTYWTRDRYEAK
jgi:hypothetical protein